jgi:hypothetical protein
MVGAASAKPPGQPCSEPPQPEHSQIRPTALAHDVVCRPIDAIAASSQSNSERSLSQVTSNGGGVTNFQGLTRTARRYHPIEPAG